MLEEAADRALVKITDLGSVLRDPSDAMRESMAMSGAELVTMCTSCKRLRADDGSWFSIEAYIQQISGNLVTHGLCETCADDTRAASHTEQPGRET